MQSFHFQTFKLLITKEITDGMLVKGWVFQSRLLLDFLQLPVFSSCDFGFVWVWFRYIRYIFYFCTFWLIFHVTFLPISCNGLFRMIYKTKSTVDSFKVLWCIFREVGSTISESTSFCTHGSHGYRAPVQIKFETDEFRNWQLSTCPLDRQLRVHL